VNLFGLSKILGFKSAFLSKKIGIIEQEMKQVNTSFCKVYSELSFFICLTYQKKRLSQKGSLFFYEIFCNFSHEEKSKKEAGV
jgi:hypothetical protein